MTVIPATRDTQRRAYLLFLFVFFTLGISVGCSNQVKVSPLTGRVTFKGQPISDGAKIYFSNPQKGIHITAPLDEDGRYRVEIAEGYGLPAGEYGVAVLPPMLMPSAEMIEKYRKGGPPPELMAFPKIPLRYRKPETSLLVLKLPPEGTTFDVEMTP